MTNTAFDQISAKEYTRVTESMGLVELLKGQLVARSKGGAAHQRAVLAVAAFLRTYGTKGVAAVGPQELYLSEDSVLLPDAFWVSKTSEKCRLRGDRWCGAPDVVVEVLAQTSAKLDRGLKFDLYEKHGVREYWLLDNADQYAEIYRLERGQFIRQGLFTADQAFRSTPLGVQVSVVDLLG